MTPRIRVLAAWQFGQVKLVDARRGAVRRALVRAITTHLFGPGTPAELGDVRRDFGTALNAFTPPTKGEHATAIVEILIALGLRNGEAKGIAMPADSDDVENALCLSLHGLGLALAGPMLAAAAAGVADGAAGDAPDAVAHEEARAEAPAAGALCIDRAVVEHAIAQLLPRWTVRAPGEPVELDRGSCRMVAKVLLECAVQALPAGKVAFGPQRTERIDGSPRTRQDVCVGDRAFRDRLQSMMAELPYRFTMQPLQQPASYRAAPEAGARDAADAFDVRLIGYRRVNRTLARFRKQADAAAATDARFGKYVAAVDAQQAVAWRINRPVLARARTLADLTRAPGSPEATQALQQAREAGMSDDAIAALAQWVRQEFYSRTDWSQSRKVYRYPGDLLDHPLARAALDDLTRVDASGHQPAFYLPWKADYRGRIYAETPWLSPQGGDLQRALFEFADGRALDGAGVTALRRHGGNLASRGVVLRDLEIRGRTVLTLADREAWVAKREAQILRSAAMPLAEPFWREASGDPMQFLAFCFAYAEWKEKPQAPIHTPVQIDGTCNGLQHIAAIVGSEKLAQAVNVVARDDGLPGDIYIELAEIAAGGIGQLGRHRKQTEDRGMVLADAWLAEHPARHALLGRNLAKPVVMTVPYGAGVETQARQMLGNHLIGEFAAKPFSEEELQAAEPLQRWVAENSERGALVASLTDGFEDTWVDRLRKEAADDPHAIARKDTAFALLAHLALALVTQVRLALDSVYPEVAPFTRWLQRVGEWCEGVPLAWATPLRFAVCQDGFAEQRQTLKVKLGGQKVSVGTVRLTERLDPPRQRTQLLPNLIHSLDSTHLAMAIHRAVIDHVGPRLHDFGSIHDCLLCHPNDAGQFARALRDSFAELYAPAAPAGGLPKVIADWAQWMRLLGSLAQAPHPIGLRTLLQTPNETVFNLCIAALGVPPPAWCAVRAEVDDLRTRLKAEAPPEREAVIDAWLAERLPGVDSDDQLQVWCDGVSRRPITDEPDSRVAADALGATQRFLLAPVEQYEAGDALAARRELTALLDRKDNSGAAELRKARAALARLHPGIRLDKATTEGTPDEGFDALTIELTPPAAGGEPPAPEAWVVCCLQIERALDRLEAAVAKSHADRQAWLRALQAAVQIRRLRDAGGADGGDRVLAAIAAATFDYAVDPDCAAAVAEARAAGERKWPTLKGRALDVSRVQKSIYFFN